MAGGTVAGWHFGGSIALGQLPFEGKEDMPLVDDPDSGMALGGRRLLGGDDMRNGAPHLAHDGEGRLWAAWIREDDAAGEQVHAVAYWGGQWREERQLTDSLGNRAAHPWVAAHKGRGAVVWAQQRDLETWDIMVHGLGPEDRVLMPAEGGKGICWRPRAVFDRAGTLWIVFERKLPGGRFAIMYSRANQDGGFTSELAVSTSPAADCCRPAIATGADGSVWVSWDQADTPGSPDVYIRKISDPKSTPIRVTQHPAADLASAIAVDDRNRVWVAWHSNRSGKDLWDIPRWFMLRCYDGGRFHDPVGEPLGKDLTKQGTDQSFEFPQLYAAPGGGVLVTGRPSHNFCLQFYNADGWSRLYRLPEDGWGGRGQYLNAAFDTNGDLWVVRRDIGANVLHRITGVPQAKGRPQTVESTEHRNAAPALVNIRRRVTPTWEPLKELDGIDTPLSHYFGDLHGHTWTSDGMGDVDEYYNIRRHYYEDDFASLTDHDTFVRRPVMPSEFELMKAMTQHLHEDGKFVTFFGQEYTTARYPTKVGHKCLYSLDQEIPLLDHLDADSNTTKKFYAQAKKHGGIVIPHHTGWTGSDWENWDPDLQMLCEIVSVHGAMEHMGNRPIPHRGGLRGHFIQDALARGLKFGLIGGSDCHGLIWHHGMSWKRDAYRGGLACVLAPELTRESLFAAMRARRTYATTGIKPRIDFRVNNRLMGEEITVSEGKVQIVVDVKAQNDLKWITIIKDNQVWYEYGGEGYLSRVSVADDDVQPGTHWYYARIEFEGPEMAWTSPVWVTRG